MSRSTRRLCDPQETRPVERRPADRGEKIAGREAVRDIAEGEAGALLFVMGAAGIDEGTGQIGIGRAGDSGREISGHVLGRITPAEMEVMNAVLERAASQVECWLSAGIEKAMNQFNGAINGSGKNE